MVWGLNHAPVRRGLLLRDVNCKTGAPSCQVVDDEVWASLVLLAIVISLPKRRGFNIHMKLSCIAKFLHTVLYSIMTLHEVFLCAVDEHVDIEVIYLLSADGTLLHIPSSAMGFPGTASVL